MSTKETVAPTNGQAPVDAMSSGEIAEVSPASGAFRSILFNATDHRPSPDGAADAPPFFADLNLDQVVAAIVAGKQEYNLAPFFHAPLHDEETVRYRQEVFRDLEDRTVLAAIRAFAGRMAVARRYLGVSAKAYDHYNQEGWFLEAAEAYGQAVEGLWRDLDGQPLASRGLTAFRAYLDQYVHSEPFTALRQDTARVRTQLQDVQYCVLIKGDTVKVRRYEGEADYSVAVEETFARFRQGAVRDYRAKASVGRGMNHIEAQILNLVARLFPEAFASLDAFCARHRNFLDPTIATFDREVQFYVAYVEHMARIAGLGLPFCYPQVVANSKDIFSQESYDLALAYKLLQEGQPVVTNDFYLQGPERVIVVTGPNQGGKTTFARTFGQLHYLASLGCPVPGRQARLFLWDQIFTHFERAEDIANLRGKLQDDLVRIHDALSRASSASILILNEIFSSTALQDALFLSQEIMRRIVALDALAVWVTFLDELASFGPQTVSMVSTVAADNPTLRTFKILRRPADGLAYALAIAEKHRLTYGEVVERVMRNE